MNRFIVYAVLFVIAAGISGAVAYGMFKGPISKAASSEKGDMKIGKNALAKTAVIESGPYRYSQAGFDVTHLTQARIDELATKLTPEEARVILKKGTEPAFCGNLTDNKKDGVYVCRLCELPLFKSDSKFHSGTGWPSFFQPVDRAHIHEERDDAYGMIRTEILCQRCGSHLGHVFDDGPQPTGLRYCVNSVSLDFYENGQELPAASKPIATQAAYFGGGCFWGVEDRFQQIPGVLAGISGYQGGTLENPTYEDVCTHRTGHAEVVKVVFDPNRVTYRQLLEKFFRFHDATQLNRQGPDVGDNYRSAIFADNDEQLSQAKAYIEELSKKPKYQTRKIVTQVETVAKAGKFYPAEEYHQDYHMKHGGHCALPPGDDE